MSIELVYPATVVQFFVDFFREEHPEWKVDHYAGEYPDEDEMREQVKSSRPTVLFDVETIDMDLELSSSDKRSIKDIIHLTVYCAVTRKRRDFTEQQIQAYTLAVLVRNSLVGTKVAFPVDDDGNTAHSESVVMPGSITKTISNETLSVYELLVTIPITTDLDYATE